MPWVIPTNVHIKKEFLLFKIYSLNIDYRKYVGSYLHGGPALAYRLS